MHPVIHPLHRSSRQQRSTGTGRRRSPWKKERRRPSSAQVSGAQAHQERRPIRLTHPIYWNTRLQDSENGERQARLMAGGGGPWGIPSSLSSFPPVSSPCLAVFSSENSVKTWSISMLSGLRSRNRDGGAGSAAGAGEGDGEAAAKMFANRSQDEGVFTNTWRSFLYKTP